MTLSLCDESFFAELAIGCGRNYELIELYAVEIDFLWQCHYAIRGVDEIALAIAGAGK